MNVGFMFCLNFKCYRAFVKKPALYYMGIGIDADSKYFNNLYFLFDSGSGINFVKFTDGTFSIKKHDPIRYKINKTYSFIDMIEIPVVYEICISGCSKDVAKLKLII